MEKHLKDLSLHQGVVARVTGFFTFVNICWLGAILGIAVSIGPSICHVLRPLRELLQRFWRWFVDDILVPTIIRLHNWGLIEIGAWAFVYGLMLDAEALFAMETGCFIAMTSLALSIPCFFYSTFIWTLQLDKPENPKTFPRLFSMWVSMTVAPCAISFDSKLLAYVAVMAFYSVLGFSVCFFGLGVAIGFDGKSAMSRVSFTSAVLLVVHTATREITKKGWQEQNYIEHIRIFDSPVAVLGSLTLYLGLLIMSSKHYYSKHRHTKRHFNSVFGSLERQQNVIMLAALLMGVLTGSITGSKGMLNTAVTFFVLYIGEHYAEFHLEQKWNGWLLLLTGSVILYEVALWLHDHPEFLVSLFNGT